MDGWEDQGRLYTHSVVIKILCTKDRGLKGIRI